MPPGIPRILAALLLASLAAAGDFSLEDAVALALANKPRVSIESLNAAAADEAVTAARSAFFPNFTIAASAAGANGSTRDPRLAAGGLNNPVILNRIAVGGIVNQLVTDLGRTSNLVDGARLRARSALESGRASRGQIVLAVHRAYFAALRAGELYLAAERAVDERLRALDRLPAGSLESRFAAMAATEARLALVSAGTDRQASRADLALVLGLREPGDWTLADPPGATEAPPGSATAIADALRSRPETAALRLERDAAARLAAADRKLSLPTVNALVNSGVAPIHDDRMAQSYSAAGLVVTIPIFNGRAFDSRRRDSELRVRMADQQLRELENAIAREVSVSNDALTAAWERLRLAARMHAEAAETVRMAKGNPGALATARANELRAETIAISARYDYLLQKSNAAFQAGRLK